MRASVLFLLVSGCALFPLGEKDCKGVNWHERGYEDGFAGAPRQDLRLIKECRERFGVEVPQDQYLAGYREGYAEWYRLQGSIDKVRMR